jgi:hypothetical protein
MRQNNENMDFPRIIFLIVFLISFPYFLITFLIFKKNIPYSLFLITFLMEFQKLLITFLMDFSKILNHYPNSSILFALLIFMNNFHNCLLNFFPYFLILITFLISKNKFPYFLFVIAFLIHFPIILNHFPYFLLFTCTPLKFT